MKFCPKCERTLEVIEGVTFQRKYEGFQPYCRECDHREKLSPRNAYTRFRKALRDAGDPSRGAWTRALFLGLHEGAKHGPWRCHYCGGVVFEWSGGYWIDRIDPSRPYWPDNCLACCWPCNREKSNYPAAEFLDFIRGKLEQYGVGKVPWHTIRPWAKRAEPPDLSRYVVKCEPPQLSLFDEVGS